MSESRVFTYDEALALMPAVHRLTATAVGQLEALLGLPFSWERFAPAELPSEHLTDYERIVSEWAASIQSLGIVVKGLWLIDFDSGSGFYCWRYPESTLQYFHSYEEGFPGRVELN